MRRLTEREIEAVIAAIPPWAEVARGGWGYRRSHPHLPLDKMEIITALQQGVSPDDHVY